MYVCISIYFCNDLNLFLLMIDKERGDENQMNRCLYLYMYYFVFACIFCMYIYNISLVSFVCIIYISCFYAPYLFDDKTIYFVY